MTLRSSVCAIIGTMLCACLVCTAPTHSSAASSTDPARKTALDAGKAEAATLLEKGKADDAYTLYSRLVRTAPDDDAVNLGLARSAAKSRHLNQAVMAYEVLLEKYPREVALYSELANVYMMQGDRVSAERSLAMVRSLDGKTTQETTDNALDAMERRYSRFQAHGKVRVGVLYDSNANAGPRSNTVDLDSWRVTVQDAKAKDTFGGYLGADIDLGWRLGQDSPWWLVGDAQGFLRGNANSGLHDTRTQESQWGRAAAGVRHLTSETLTELRVKAEVFDYEFFQNVSAFGPEGTFLWAVTPKTHLITRGGIDQRVYSQDQPRNGVYGWIGEYLRFFLGEKNHELVLGGRYIGASADKTDYSYDGWEGSARLLLKLPYAFELGPFVSFAQEYYNGPGTALESKSRRDDRWRMGSTLTYRITEAWAAEMNYQYTNNDSNCGLYKYEQHLVTTGIAWNF